MVGEPGNDQTRRIVARLDRLEAEAHNEAIRELNKEFFTHQVKENEAYTRFVVFGGYAAFFAAWGLLKEVLHQNLMVASAFFMVISVAIFTMAEIYFMWLRAEQFHAYATRLAETPSKFLELQKEYDSAFAERQIAKRDTRIFILISTVLTSALAMLLLLLGFLNYLHNLWS
ncbi:MAG: hypothetical protein ABJ388_16450 [Alphaproteobacteria bacterium]|uniref:hypothetical protein n=1 Tax=Pseudomonadota TaxID=1224 RepID=UPI0032670464